MRQEILQQLFLRLKILHLYFGLCSFVATKNKCTNVCATNICNAKNFDAKKDVAKINPQKFLWIYFCKNSFCVKNFCAKHFCVTIFCLFIFATVYFAAYIFVYLIKMTIELNMQKKRCSNYGVINIQKFLHLYFCSCLFLYSYFCIFN